MPFWITKLRKCNEKVHYKQMEKNMLNLRIEVLKLILDITAKLGYPSIPARQRNLPDGSMKEKNSLKLSSRRYIRGKWSCFQVHAVQERHLSRLGRIQDSK